MEEGRWMWYNSFKSVGQFMWITDRPNNYSTNDDCMWWFTRKHGAADNVCTRTHYPLCQIESEML